jgi:mono/diheme cytochrome c family protein
MTSTPEDDEQSDPSYAMFLAGGAAFVAFLFVVLIGGVVMAVSLSDDTNSQTVASGQSTVASDADVGQDVDSSGLGKDIYVASCSACHGANGEGVVGPTFKEVTTRIPDVALHVLVVSEGRGAMPSFKATLSPEEIDAVVAYEREVLN